MYKTSLRKMTVASPSNRFATNLFGYDFFISFKLGGFPDGAQSYASDLARRLREEDFTVFFSEEEAPPGAELGPTLTKALHSARILVVILNEGALLRSKWVRQEVEEFRRQHQKRPIIPINIDEAKEKYATDIAAWLGHEERIWLNETNEAIKNGTVSATIVKRLTITPKFMRANSRLRWTGGAVAVALLLLTIWAFIERSVAIEARDQALHNESRAFSALSGVAIADNRPNHAAQLALAAWPRDDRDQHLRLETALQNLSKAVAERLYLHQMRHDSAVDGALLTKDGRRILSWSDDSTLRLWDAATGQQIGPTMKHDGIEGALLTKDGRRILSWSSDSTLRLWDAATGLPIGPAMKHDDPVPMARC
jgi:hypothetical protein